MLSSHQQQQHRHDGDAAVRVRLQALLRGEKDYLAGLANHHDVLVGAAGWVAHESPLSQLLLEEARGGNSEDPSRLLDECRTTIKRFALQNVDHHRQVQAYLQGLRTLESPPPQNEGAEDEGDDEGEGSGTQSKKRGSSTTSSSGVVDYSKRLKEAMSQAFAQMEADQSAPPEEDPIYYVPVVTTLNEPKNNQDPTNDEDDDIAVLGGANGGAGGASLKCPITGLLMDHPYKNRVCGHVYEQHAILNHLKTDRKKNCPVTGCATRGITKDDLVEDRAMMTLIRRQRVRDQKQKEIEKQSQNAIEMDDDSDDE